jgi:hypothetical protein
LRRERRRTRGDQRLQEDSSQPVDRARLLEVDSRADERVRPMAREVRAAAVEVAEVEVEEVPQPAVTEDQSKRQRGRKANEGWKG